MQHATSATEHKLGTHLDAGCNLYEITGAYYSMYFTSVKGNLSTSPELHGKVLTEQLHQANNNSAVCCSEVGIYIAQHYE